MPFTIVIEKLLDSSRMKRRRKSQPVAINPLVVDLSHHNDVADFGKVKAAGIAGIIHKATEASGLGFTRVPGTLHSAGSRTPETQQVLETFAGMVFLSQHLAVDP
jgi:hypothetical protein